MKEELPVTEKVIDVFDHSVGLKRPRILVIGPPLSGKSTLVSSLAREMGVRPILWGKITRVLKGLGNSHPLGSMLREFDEKDIPHPSELTTKLLFDDFIIPTEQGSRGWVLDGFVRNSEEMQALYEKTNNDNRPLTDIVVIDAEDTLLHQRAKTRIICPKCDKAFNMSSGISTCDNDDTELTSRADDQRLSDRLGWYSEDTRPLIENLSNLYPDINIITVSANTAPNDLVNNVITCLSHRTDSATEKVRWKGAHYDIEADTTIPMQQGTFDFKVFKNRITGEEHIGIFKGNVDGKSAVPVRIHSSCITGDIFKSNKCDCGPQLEHALKLIENKGEGIVIYLQQEGRGIGLANKIKAYALQSQGVDTVDANRMLNLPDDARTFDPAADILDYAGALSYQLITNNPLKVLELQKRAFDVVGTIETTGFECDDNADYLNTKNRRMKHNTLQR